jgi:hypothetical protein
VDQPRTDEDEMSGESALMAACILLSIAVAVCCLALFFLRRLDAHFLRLVELTKGNSEENDGIAEGTLLPLLMVSHFAPTSVQNITISERQFPFRVRADLQRAIDRLFSAETQISHFSGMRNEFSHEGVGLSDLRRAGQ